MRTIPAVLLALVAATPAAAQFDTAPPPPVALSGNVGVTTDYRFRGFSYSGNDPAVQATLTADHRSGAYASLFFSTLNDDEPLLRDFGPVEFDGYLGYAGEIAPRTSLDVGIAYYLYAARPRGARPSYAEAYATLGHTLGPVTAQVGTAYTPAQGRATEGFDYFYVFGGLRGTIPNTPVGLVARLGHQDFGGDYRYLEWELGGTYEVGPVTLGAAYMDTSLRDEPLGKGRLVFSAAFNF